jgi:hypothetical protein
MSRKRGTFKPLRRPSLILATAGPIGKLEREKGYLGNPPCDAAYGI